MKEFDTATIWYYNNDERQFVNCNNRTLTKKLDTLKKCKWINNIEVFYYNTGIEVYRESFKVDNDKISIKNLNENEIFWIAHKITVKRINDNSFNI